MSVETDQGTAQIIDGKAVAAELRLEVAESVAKFKQETGRTPVLATVLVGDDPASHIYVGNKHKACAEVGITSEDHRLPADTPAEELIGVLTGLNDRADVDGILLQLPLPNGLDDNAMTELIDPAKDVDGLTTVNAGRVLQARDALVPCTPSGVMRLLRSAGATLEGAEAVVVGRSNLVGKPVASLLLRENATVTVCHSRTKDLAEVCRRADVLVACVGSPKLVTGKMIKPGAIVIDVGTTRGPDGLTGDVDFDAARQVAGAITPVPGGVGPMTIACLLENTVKAARARKR
ncbi:MAG TPA: bifunctional methylenetetrahydrofolate dehydrogenase/methenyltetrahydrofolate cyclohydrolase FolD [Solirubrobacterales bacterium]|jgi:methylenetetrahydrofolate dehydrogenase (NADP+)/methenyltetrahydrofolate cyclohydrolase|nr:bifunctional methylenetetrahydrofolate dehydrogenase/methenyltetrahydrofolate cyclohydrolase FolD [Solirubrobacterales bacterium]